MSRGFFLLSSAPSTELIKDFQDIFLLILKGNSNLLIKHDTEHERRSYIVEPKTDNSQTVASNYLHSWNAF